MLQPKLQPLAPVPRPLHTLKIVPFSNRGGTISFRVTGRVLKKPVRSNFPTREEAETYFHKRTEGLNNAAPKTAILTTLAERVVREVESELPKLPAGKSIRDAVDFYVAHYKPLVPLPWADAADRYKTHLRRERKTEQATADRRELEAIAFARYVAKEHALTVTEGVTKAMAKGWIYAPDLDDRSQRDRYDRLNQLLAWLISERHATFNPVPELPRPKVRQRVPAILTVEQIQTLLTEAWTDAEGPQMLPHFAITTLSGVRPDECRYLEPDDIHLDSAHPTIEVNRAKGGRSRRNVEICPALLAILKVCHEKRLSPGFFSKRKFDRVRKDAGLFDLWVKDISRHSYASYRYELDRDIDGLVKNMGNSAKVLFTNYIRAVTHEAAEVYDKLAPDWKAPRKVTLEGKRADLWEKLPRSVLSPVQRRIVAERAKRRESAKPATFSFCQTAT